MSGWLPREIEAQRPALRQVLQPIETAGGLPNETYTSAALHTPRGAAQTSRE